MGYVPDNYDAFVIHETEYERSDRLRKRIEKEMEELKSERINSKGESDTRKDRF
jgi:hypothetical protein